MPKMQPSLFEQASLNVSADLKMAMNRAARTSNLSREQILDCMRSLARRYGVPLKLSLPTLEKWLNPMDSTHQPTIQAIVLFCAVTEETEPMSVLVNPLGRVVTRY